MKTKIVSILFFVFLLFGEATKAQVNDATKVSKKAKKNYEQAMLKVDEGDYPSALVLLNQAIDRNPAYLDAVLSKAGILSELKRYDESALAYEKAFVIDLDQ